MKTRTAAICTFLIIVIQLFSFSYSYAQYFSIPFEKVTRTYLLHLPSGYSEKVEHPLVIAMHGGFGNAYNIQEQSKLSQKADQENFIVVYPEGTEGRVLGARTWNAGWCCGYSSAVEINDVGFINSLLDTLIKKYSIDKNKVYATGMSNGGFMAYRLACELSERIAAIAPVAASMSLESCTPSREMPIIHFHSYLDESVPFTGGVGKGISDHYNTPIDSVLNYWSTINCCNKKKDTIVNNDQYIFIKRTSCKNESDIHCYITKDGGHSWPGGKKTRIGNSASSFINATDLMWSFFKQHSLNH